MATIEELEAREENLRVCEAAAMKAFAAGMRELAVELPDGSRLALHFAKLARTVDSLAIDDPLTSGSGTDDLEVCPRAVRRGDSRGGLMAARTERTASATPPGCGPRRPSLASPETLTGPL